MNLYIIHAGPGFDFFSLLDPEVQARSIRDRATKGLPRWPSLVPADGSGRPAGSAGAAISYIESIRAVSPDAALHYHAATANAAYAMISTLNLLSDPTVQRLHCLPRLTSGYEAGIDAALIMRETEGGPQWWIL